MFPDFRIHLLYLMTQDMENLKANCYKLFLSKNLLEQIHINEEQSHELQKKTFSSNPEPKNKNYG